MPILDHEKPGRVPTDLLCDVVFGGKVILGTPPDTAKYIRQINELPTITKFKPAN